MNAHQLISPRTARGECLCHSIKAGGIEGDKLRPAIEDLTIESVKGKVFMRKCDHQGVQQGFMVKVVKKDGFDHPIPEVIAVLPAERTTPPCNKMTYDD